MSVTVQNAPQLRRSFQFEGVSADSAEYWSLAPCVPDDYTLFGEFMRNPAERIHVRLGNSRFRTQRPSANEIAGTMSHAIVARRATRGGNPEAMTNRKGLKNTVLASLPAKEGARLETALEPVSLKFGQVLYEPGKAIRHVYFPIDCLISLLTAVDKRRSLEVGMVGNEGMAGMPFILGMGVSGVRALVQGGGEALRMAAGPFRKEFDRNPALQEALYRYMYALMAQISQTAACNRFHEAEPRLARWLLMTRDRVMSDEFPLTHEFLAHMLGMRREGVTEAAGALKRQKLIRYQRGKIQILDLKGLKAKSCSCYQIVQTAFQRVQGHAISVG
jgi:CRP-like cAMP-binding protein